MFGKKEPTEYHIYPGIYKINIPFFRNSFMHLNENGEADVFYCLAIIHVGIEYTQDNTKIVKVLLQEDNKGFPVENHVNEIATTIRRSYLTKIFDRGLPPEYAFVWEVTYVIDNARDFCSVTMSWDEKNQVYQSLVPKFIRSIPIEQENKKPPPSTGWEWE
ncbi:hypothetical protein [Neobacillus cucumis]|uniref:hypothetical protein n=1 Tax=Neobacillus cucumis TaxID=1740721 RepID=UPI002E1D5CDC|nr:hypothetical protein [Neobacillus cucumis]